MPNPKSPLARFHQVVKEMIALRVAMAMTYF